MRHRRHALIIFIAIGASAAPIYVTESGSSLGGLAFAQTEPGKKGDANGSATSMPIPGVATKSAPTQSTVNEPDGPWWKDTKWWAIIVSLIFGLVNIGVSVNNRKHANEQFKKSPILKAEEDEFIRRIRDPLDETLAAIRKFRSSIRAAAQLQDPTARAARFKASLETDAPTALGELMDTLAAIDHCQDTHGEWVQIAADLEDSLYPALTQLDNAALTAARVVQLHGQVATTLNDAITACGNKANECRRKILEA